MQIYIYDKDTREYLETRKAQPNPKKTGEFLKPVNSTFEQLPQYDKKSETIIFSDHWEVMKDFRGQYVFDSTLNQIISIDYIGEIKNNQTLMGQEEIDEYIAYPERFVVKNGELVNVIGTAEFAQILEDKFNDEFIQTNIGYVRKDTKWGNFLTIKPNYDLQFNQLGFLPEGVLILYKKPDFFMFDGFHSMNEWLLSEGQFKNEKIEKDNYFIFSNLVLQSFMHEV